MSKQRSSTALLVDRRVIKGFISTWSAEFRPWQSNWLASSNGLGFLSGGVPIQVLSWHTNRIAATGRAFIPAVFLTVCRTGFSNSPGHQQGRRASSNWFGRQFENPSFL
jgi:hypothetical protein